MTEFLVKRFVKDHEKIDKMSVRTAYGVLSSIVGIVCNVFLFFVKYFLLCVSYVWFIFFVML